MFHWGGEGEGGGITKKKNNHQCNPLANFCINGINKNEKIFATDGVLSTQDKERALLPQQKKSQEFSLCNMQKSMNIV